MGTANLKISSGRLKKFLSPRRCSPTADRPSAFVASLLLIKPFILDFFRLCPLGFKPQKQRIYAVSARFFFYSLGFSKYKKFKDFLIFGAILYLQRKIRQPFRTAEAPQNNSKKKGSVL